MSKFKCRMNDEIQMTNVEIIIRHLNFDIRHSFDI